MLVEEACVHNILLEDNCVHNLHVEAYSQTKQVFIQTYFDDLYNKCVVVNSIVYSSKLHSISDNMKIKYISVTK